MNAPIIKLEIEAMRHSLRMALTEHATRMDSDVKAAVDAFCTEENLTAIIRSEASRALDAIVRSEVQDFFRHGEGKKFVAAEVKRRLLENNTFTPLDYTD